MTININTDSEILYRLKRLETEVERLEEEIEMLKEAVSENAALEYTNPGPEYTNLGPTGPLVWTGVGNARFRHEKEDDKDNS